MAMNDTATVIPFPRAMACDPKAAAALGDKIADVIARHLRSDPAMPKIREVLKALAREVAIVVLSAETCDQAAMTWFDDELAGCLEEFAPQLEAILEQEDDAS